MTNSRVPALRLARETVVDPVDRDSQPASRNLERNAKTRAWRRPAGPDTAAVIPTILTAVIIEWYFSPSDSWRSTPDQMRDRLCGQEYFLRERARRESLRSTHISGKTAGSTGALAVPVEGI